jgi:phospholipase C
LICLSLIWKAGVILNMLEMAGDRRRLARLGVNSSDRPDPAAGMGGDRLPQIGHIVILMMENHSYDNYFGLLTGMARGAARC